MSLFRIALYGNTPEEPPVYTYNLLLASSGEEALDLLGSELKAGRKIAAGFFDIRMRGGDGRF